MHGLIAMSLVVAWVSVVQAQSPAVFDRAQPGVWSSAGKYLWPGPTAVADFPLGRRNIVVASPDDAIPTRVTNIDVSLVDCNNPNRYAQTSIHIANLVEILRALTHSAFSLTQLHGR